MRLYKAMIFKLLFWLTIAPAFGASYYGGGAAVRPHGHSGVGDGGVISNLTILGKFKADTLVIKSSATAARPIAPSTGTIYYNTTLGAGELFDGSNWNKILVTPSSFSAIGGTELIIGGYREHTLINGQSLTVTGTSNPDVEILICGGGGGGGGTVGYYGGGGGAGGCIQRSTITLTPGVYTSTMGAGGGSNDPGGNSYFLGFTAFGGGKGQTVDGGGAEYIACQSGGSGGGAIAGAGCAGTTGQGFAGGSAPNGTGGGVTSAGTSDVGSPLEWPAGSGNYFGQGGDDRIAGCSAKAANSANGGNGGYNAAGCAGGSGIIKVRYRVSVTGGAMNNYVSSATWANTVSTSSFNLTPNYAVCKTATGAWGVCSSSVTASGSCTCN